MDRPAMGVVIGTQALTMCLVAKNFIVYPWLNRKADRGEIVLEGKPSFRLTT